MNPVARHSLLLALLVWSTYGSAWPQISYVDYTDTSDLSTPDAVIRIPPETVSRTLVTASPVEARRVCAADEATLMNTTTEPANNIPGSIFRAKHYMNYTGSSTVWNSITVHHILNVPYAEVPSRHMLYCAVRDRNGPLSSLPSSASVKIIRTVINLTGAPQKPQPVLELPATLSLGDISPGQRVEAPIPVIINCNTCPDGQITQGDLSWRLESSPDNPSAERPGLMWMEGESAGTSGTNVVTFGRFQTEVSGYGLRWPRTNSAPLVPGTYRWTLTMTLSIQ